MSEQTTGPLPELDLKKEKQVAEELQKIFSQRSGVAAIDISFGGTLTALLRMLFAAIEAKVELNIGFDFDNLQQSDLDSFLWGESAHSYLISTPDSTLLQNLKVPANLLGQVTDHGQLNFNQQLKVSVNKVYKAFSDGLAHYF